ncbi:hypothetical protein ZIOFF_075153 [Zingiber officinale]|uniref:Uncharacterized protein n=1 Tax=Zingiber officinale TaxID=94328 RepID=A0A8J5EL36_ZINOF|nr:hypothetical protein ZIOFF_075153 [Zingiber officinale]
MAEFSPELEDGERWLPADILKDVGARHPYDFTCPAPSGGRECFPRLAYLNTLARELASLGIFHHPAVSSPSLFSPSPHYFVRFPSPSFSLPLLVSSSLTSNFASHRRCSTYRWLDWRTMPSGSARFETGSRAQASTAGVAHPVAFYRFKRRWVPTGFPLRFKDIVRSSVKIRTNCRRHSEPVAENKARRSRGQGMDERRSELNASDLP